MAVTDVLFSGLVSGTAATSSSDSITAALVDSAGRVGQLDLSQYRDLAVWVQLKTLSGGTTPSVQVILDTGDGQATTYWAHLNGDAPTWTAQNNQYQTSIGPGTSHNASLGNLGRFIWNITGGPTTVSFYVHIVGKR